LPCHRPSHSPSWNPLYRRFLLLEFPQGDGPPLGTGQPLISPIPFLPPETRDPLNCILPLYPNRRASCLSSILERFFWGGPKDVRTRSFTHSTPSLSPAAVPPHPTGPLLIGCVSVYKVYFQPGFLHEFRPTPPPLERRIALFCNFLPCFPINRPLQKVPFPFDCTYFLLTIVSQDCSPLLYIAPINRHPSREGLAGSESLFFSYACFPFVLLAACGRIPVLVVDAPFVNKRRFIPFCLFVTVRVFFPIPFFFFQIALGRTITNSQLHRWSILTVCP